MAVVLFASRLVLATVLGVAGVAKLIDRQGTRRALLDFGVPARLARPAALVLPLIELATAAALVPSRSGRWGAVAALGLLSVFSIAVGIALVRGRRPDCHCFGQLHASQAGWRTLIRNLGLMVLAAAIVWVYPTTAAPTTGQALLVLGFAAAALTVAAQAWIWFQLLHQNGRVLSRLEQLEQRQPSTTESATPHIGAPAPAFDLPAVNGGRLGLPGLLARGRPVLLVFGHSSCGPCQALLPQLARWQDDLAEHLTVALVNEGVLETGGPPLRNVAIQIEREVADAYGVTGTPAAILIGQDGLVESTLALGSGAIEALVPAAAPKRNETGTLSSIRPGVALVAGAAALAVAASAAGAGSVSEYGQEVDDPELVGLRVAIKLANPRLAADAREVHRALVALAGARNKHAAQAVVGTAMRKERQHLLELRAMLRAVPTSGERAIEAKQLAIRSLTLLANGRDRFARAVASPRASDSIRLLKQAQTPLQQARSLAYGANILLGCTGKDC